MDLLVFLGGLLGEGGEHHVADAAARGVSGLGVWWWERECGYRDLKEPEGWVFSSLRKMLHPAARERGGEKRRGVSTQGLGGSREREPMLCGGGGVEDWEGWCRSWCKSWNVSNDVNRRLLTAAGGPYINVKRRDDQNSGTDGSRWIRSYACDYAIATCSLSMPPPAACCRYPVPGTGQCVRDDSCAFQRHRCLTQQLQHANAALVW